MKVAFIRDYFAMGGIETVLHNNALDLKEFGFEFYAICTGKSAYKGNHLWDTYKEVKVIILPNDIGGIERIGYFRIQRSTPDLRE